MDISGYRAVMVSSFHNFITSKIYRILFNFKLQLENSICLVVRFRVSSCWRQFTLLYSTPSTRCIDTRLKKQYHPFTFTILQHSTSSPHSTPLLPTIYIHVFEDHRSPFFPFTFQIYRSNYEYLNSHIYATTPITTSTQYPGRVPPRRQR